MFDDSLTKEDDGVARHRRPQVPLRGGVGGGRHLGGWWLGSLSLPLYVQPLSHASTQAVRDGRARGDEQARREKRGTE